MKTSEGKSRCRTIGWSCRSLLAALPVLVGLLLIVQPAPGLSAAAQERQVSDHFDGKRFHNDVPDHSFSDMVRWLWEMKTVEWPEWIEDPKQHAPEKQCNSSRLRVTYVNHATMLIQTDGLNILTDPIWSTVAGPSSWLGVKRVRLPGVTMEDLPKIDVILLSHDHYDHLDMPTLKQIAARDNPLIIAGLGIRNILKPDVAGTVIELDWWEVYEIQPGDMRLTFVPSLHESGRGIMSHNETLWGGFVMEGRAGRIYFAGDTGYGSFLDALRKRYDRFRLTIFPVGSYEKRWFMKSRHMNPDDAVKAHILLGSQQSIGMHFSTFAEHPEQTIDAHEHDLAAALVGHGLDASRFRILRFGEGIDIP